MAVKCNIASIVVDEAGKMIYQLKCHDNTIDILRNYIDYLGCTTDTCNDDVPCTTTKKYWQGCKSIPYTGIWAKLYLDNLTEEFKTENCIDEDGFVTGGIITTDIVYKDFYIRFYKDNLMTIPYIVTPLNLPVIINDGTGDTTILVGDGVISTSSFYLGKFMMSGTTGNTLSCSTTPFFNFWTLSDDNECFTIAPPTSCLAPHLLFITIENAS